MKKVRVLLAASAVLLAIGGTFASTVTFTYWERTTQPGGSILCVAHTVDNECAVDPLGAICKTGVILRQNDVENPGMCGQEVRRID